MELEAGDVVTVSPGDRIQITIYPVVTLDVGGAVAETHGVPGELAEVIELEEGGWVTAWFDRTQTASSVSPDNYRAFEDFNGDC